MISFLIPTYNYICKSFVIDLQKQAEDIKNTKSEPAFDYEIIVADDYSTDKTVIETNREINNIEGCRVIEMSHNIGRAAIRNMLAKEARFPYIVFIDSDAIMNDSLYVSRYFEASIKGYDVVCGSLWNTKRLPSEAHTLRFFYERNADKTRDAKTRRNAPYSRFTTFNFMIKRDIFMKIMFNENCIHYGYEDTYFGMELERSNIYILHIDNQLIHTGIEDNKCFLKKTETALRTLHSLDADFKKHARVSNTAILIESIHLKFLIRFLYQCTSNIIRKNLLGKKPSMFLFNLYKLGYYCSLK